MTKFTRQQLYKLVWEKPTVQIAKEIGVSDVAIAKACKRHEIPRPPVGYWAMLQHGKRVVPTPLLKPSDAALEIIEFEPLSSEQREARETEKDAMAVHEELKIAVLGVLQSPHPLIERTRRILNAGKPDEAGVCHFRAKNRLCAHSTDLR